MEDVLTKSLLRRRSFLTAAVLAAIFSVASPLSRPALAQDTCEAPLLFRQAYEDTGPNLELIYKELNISGTFQR